MAKACKCDPHEICEECPEWIFTLADLIMCMMGLFVLLWVLKPAGSPKKDDPPSLAADEKWKETVGEIRGGFGWEPNPSSTDPIDQAIIRKRERLGAGQGGETIQAPRGAEGTDPEVQTIRPGKHAIVGTRVLFDAGKADLSDEAKRALEQVAKTIQGHRQIFLVKGHASQDDFAAEHLPPAQLAPRQMDVSLRRAQAAADYLVAHGVEPEMLRVQGCSTFEPVARRAYTDDLRVQNRRVEVEGTDTGVTERQDDARTSHVLPPGLATETADAPTETIDRR